MTASRVLVAATFAAATAAAASWALDGAYTGPSGTQVEFADDGALHVMVPTGDTFDALYSVDGDTLTIDEPSEESVCSGVTGTYTVAESDEGVTFTVVSDECAARVEDLTGGVWTMTAAPEE